MNIGGGSPISSKSRRFVCCPAVRSSHKSCSRAVWLLGGLFKSQRTRPVRRAEITAVSVCSEQRSVRPSRPAFVWMAASGA